MPVRRSPRPRTRGKHKTVADIGEMGLIARIDRCVSRASSSSKSRAIVLGIGDDAALLRARSGEEVAVSTDTAVEGIHFDWRVDDASAIGRRALAAALSDLAAMGARPLGCTLALAVDTNLELRRLDASLRAFVDEAEKRGCALSGGNVASAGETSFAVTVVGAVARGKALLRSSTRAGDGLFVTGMLGGAALARAVAESRGDSPSNRFVPPDRLAAGRALAGLAAARRRPACIDLSDGLAADLPHLLAGSAGKRLGAEVELDRLPRVRGFERRCVDVGLDPVQALVAGGEDYELLFTLSGRWAQESQLGALEARLGAPVTRIGDIGERPGIRGLPRGYSGYRHF